MIAAVVVPQLSRDFGAKMLKRDHCKGLIPDPHVAVVELCPEDEFLIIGSDGLFEVFTNHRQLVKVVKETLRSTGACGASVLRCALVGCRGHLPWSARAGGG
jgi:serine/threonine protein phosphatase PrpC